MDDSIDTFIITYTCYSPEEWEGCAILYNLLLSFGLMFLSYQNAKIKTHFAQEGEFAARAVFVVFLFVLPCFLIHLMLTLLSDHGLGLFWIRLIFTVSFPSAILGGLYIPKVSPYHNVQPQSG